VTTAASRVTMAAAGPEAEPIAIHEAPVSNPTRAPDDSDDETTERILDAATASFLEFGFRRTTMEDVARRIGVSRVTVYRHHVDKSALFQAVLLREFQRTSAEIERRLVAFPEDRNPVVEGFVLAIRHARRHPLVRRLLSAEPEWIVLHTTLQGEALMTWSIGSATAFLRQPRFAEWLVDGDPGVTAEILVRLLQSAVIAPGGLLASEHDDDLRRVAASVMRPLVRDAKRRR